VARGAPAMQSRTRNARRLIRWVELAGGVTASGELEPVGRNHDLQVTASPATPTGMRPDRRDPPCNYPRMKLRSLRKSSSLRSVILSSTPPPW
jgi:hypothetical protein